MEFDDVVKARRSIRKFAERDVSETVVTSLIDCALHAPSSMNGQPWRFIVVRNAETKRRIAQKKEEHCPPEKKKFSAKFIESAPVIIVTCVERAKSFNRGMESGVLATGHLLLAAANHGLTGVYMSAYEVGVPRVAEDFREILALPADIDPITIVPMGYPGEAPLPKTLRSVAEVISHEAFGC